MLKQVASTYNNLCRLVPEMCVLLLSYLTASCWPFVGAHFAATMSGNQTNCELSFNIFYFMEINVCRSE